MQILLRWHPTLGCRGITSSNQHTAHHGEGLHTVHTEQDLHLGELESFTRLFGECDVTLRNLSAPQSINMRQRVSSGSGCWREQQHCQAASREVAHTEWRDRWREGGGLWLPYLNRSNSDNNLIVMLLLIITSHHLQL